LDAGNVTGSLGKKKKDEVDQMKRNFSCGLFSIGAVVMFAANASASPILTGIVDGPGSTPKGVEVYLDGSYDGYKIQIESNGGSDWSDGFTFDATSYTAGLYIVTSTSADTYLTSVYAAANILADSSFNQNGNDAIRIVDTGNNVIDQYGDPSQVTGSSDHSAAWDFEDSYAYRLAGTGPDGAFNASNWTFGGNNYYDNGGSLGDEGLGAYSVPEPTTLALAGLGLFGWIGIRRRRR
jgi:hypothetical protein